VAKSSITSLVQEAFKKGFKNNREW